MRDNNYWKKRFQLEDDESIRKAEEALLEVSAGIEEDINDDIVHISQISDRIEKEYKEWGQTKGLLTGLPRLDEKIRGISAGHVVLISGETSNGKSALATNIAVNVSRERPVLFITLEMVLEEIGSRIMHLNGGTVDNLDLLFQSEHRITYKDIGKLLARAKEEANIEMVVLDYLQYLGRGMTEREVAVMSKEIKTLALEHNIPFVVIVSLRKGEGGKNKRKWTEIEIEDIMGTGAIGYDCDVAMVASRKDLNNEFDNEHVYVKVLKVRNGKLDYDDRYLCFKWDETRIYEDWASEAKLEINGGYTEA